MNAPITKPVDSLNALLAKQRSAFARDGAPSYETRMGDLAALKKAVLARRSQFEQAISEDFGSRSPYETALMEIMPTVQGIDYLRRHLKKWMRPKHRDVALHTQPGRAMIVYQPLGVIGIVAPWNFPMGLALTPLATALAAGNRAMIKPSELTPATSALMAQMLADIFREKKSRSSRAVLMSAQRFRPCPSIICSSPAARASGALSCARPPTISCR